jgi:hypothetical protein
MWLQDNSVISGNGQTHSTPQPSGPPGQPHMGSRAGSVSRASHFADTQSNAYATINKVSILLICFRRYLRIKPGANPTIARYNASAVKIYNATSSLVSLESKNIFLLL